MRRVVVVLVVAAAELAGGPAHSHGGGLNAEGCHTNRKTGEYHCHRAGVPPRSGPPPAPPRLDPGGDGARWRCGDKTSCKQMSSCQEARFHLSQCGLSRLDGDGDGVPCESLCR